MNCLKCGRDIAEDQLFCESCLEVMDQYPVKPNTAIQLPHREELPPVKKPSTKRRQAPSAEEKLRTAKRFIRRILILWLVTLGLLIASLFPAVKYILGDRIRLPGQNYSSISTTPTETTAPTQQTTPSASP